MDIWYYAKFKNWIIELKDLTQKSIFDKVFLKFQLFFGSWTDGMKLKILLIILERFEFDVHKC